MRALLLLLMPALLMAQRPSLSPAEGLDRELKRNRLGTWLVLEDEGAAWGAPLRAALNEEPLLELNLPLKVVAGGKKPDAQAPLLRERYSWTKGAHWALVDAAGRVLVERSQAPTSASVATAAEQAGVQSRSEELEAFLRRNPDHLDAQNALLRERILLATKRTLKALGPPKPAPSGTNAAPEPPPMLDPEADLRIWARVVGQLDRLLQGRWQEMGYELGLAVNMSTGSQSPSMAALLTRYRGDIESALQRRPSAQDTWFLWLGASKVCGGWPLSPLLQSLQPLPGTQAAEWPPSVVLNEYIRDAKSRRDWAGIRSVLEPRWDEIKVGGNPWSGGPYLWNMFISPLLEALVSLGDVSTADQVMGEAMAMDNAAGGLPGQARDLATRLGRPDLAVRWGALMPKGR